MIHVIYLFIIFLLFLRCCALFIELSDMRMEWYKEKQKERRAAREAIPIKKGSTFTNEIRNGETKQ